MKLHKLVETHNREYLELAQRYISKIGNGLFYLTPDGLINSRASDGFATDLIGHGYHRDTLDLFTDDGVFKLEFGVVESEFLINYVREMRSLKNMPRVIKKSMYLTQLYHIEKFDLEIKECNKLNIKDCRFVDLSNIKNTKNVLIKNCGNCDTLDKLPHNMENDDQLLQIADVSIRQITTNNNNIANIYFDDVWGIKNFMNLPKQMKNIKLLARDFDNWQGVGDYKKLYIITAYVRKYKNIINLLLCDSLTDKNNLNITYVPEHVNNIIHSFIIKDKKDHIMDCALELIEAGFEEAAEL